jgi:hypothetical protein
MSSPRICGASDTLVIIVQRGPDLELALLLTCMEVSDATFTDPAAFITLGQLLTVVLHKISPARASLH